MNLQMSLAVRSASVHYGLLLSTQTGAYLVVRGMVKAEAAKA